MCILCVFPFETVRQSTRCSAGSQTLFIFNSIYTIVEIEWFGRILVSFATFHAFIIRFYSFFIWENNDSLCGISDHSRRKKSDTPEKISNSQKIETHRKVTDLENIDLGPHIHHFCKGIVLYRTILEIFIRKKSESRKFELLPHIWHFKAFLTCIYDGIFSTREKSQFWKNNKIGPFMWHFVDFHGHFVGFWNMPLEQKIQFPKSNIFHHIVFWYKLKVLCGISDNFRRKKI